MSTIINEQLQEWRAKAAAGTLTIEEMKLAIAAIRKERAQIESTPKPKSRAAGATSTPRAKKQRPEDIDSNDLLKELGI